MTQARLQKLYSQGVQYPIMQAGMPVAGNVRLAAAVSRAGGIGTLGLQDVSVWEQSLKQLKQQAAAHPVNANLLLPYTRKAHVQAVIRQQVPIVTLFWGKAQPCVRPLHEAGCFLFQQVGSVDEAKQALDAGVDGLIVQGEEAGGHVRGTLKLQELLPQVRALTQEIPCFAAGGIYTAEDVRRAVSLGADGISTGSRFLLTDESGAHSAYKQRLLDASETLKTTLFGLGWATPHRVVPNAATQRWCDKNGAVPAWLDGLHKAFGFTRKIAPFKPDAARGQRADIPFFTNAVIPEHLSAELVESCPLYAGERVKELTDIQPAAQVVQSLAQGFERDETRMQA